jgi:putative DNA primase/helicase
VHGKELPVASVGGGRSIEEEGRALVERLGGRWTPRGGLCRCPAHDDSHPSLSVRPGRSRLLLHCFAGCRASEILSVLQSCGILSPCAATSEVPSAFYHAASPLSEAALRLWDAGRGLAGTLAARYLAGRCLAPDSRELRFHPRVPHGPKPFTRLRPALVAAVRDAAGLVAVHRSFLDPRRPRLAEIDEPKRALGPLGRGAVRLGGVAPLLGLAEGIETALSATALFGTPCWATLGTERFVHIELPAEVQVLRLFLDNDAGGRRGEALAREAFSGRLKIEPFYPPREGEDWNDVLIRLRRGRRG